MTPLHNWKSKYDFRLFQNLSADILRLTRSLTTNIQKWSIHICMLYTYFYAFITYLAFSYFFSISRLCSLCKFFQIVTNLQKSFPIYLLKKKTQQNKKNPFMWVDPCSTNPCYLKANYFLLWLIQKSVMKVLKKVCILFKLCHNVVDSLV